MQRICGQYACTYRLESSETISYCRIPSHAFLWEDTVFFSMGNLILLPSRQPILVSSSGGQPGKKGSNEEEEKYGVTLNFEV